MHVQLVSKKPNQVSKKTITGQVSCQKVKNINIAGRIKQKIARIKGHEI